MKTLTRVVLIGWLLLLTGIASADQTPVKTVGSKEAKVRRLLALTKAEDMAMQGLDALMGAMRSSMPQVTEEFWKTFKAQVKADELVDLLVPVYADNFDESDVDGLIQFYESPVGQTFVAKQGLILQQSMAVGQKWGEQLAERAIQQLQTKSDD